MSYNPMYFDIAIIFSIIAHACLIWSLKKEEVKIKNHLRHVHDRVKELNAKLRNKI